MSAPKTSSRVTNDANKVPKTSDLDKVDWLIKSLRGFDVGNVRDRWDPSLESLQKRINVAMTDIFGAGTPEYKKFAQGAFDAELDSTFNNRYSPEELRQAVKVGMEKSIASLNTVKALLNERARRQAAPAATPAPAPAAGPAAAPAPTSAPVQAPTPPAPAPAAAHASTPPTPAPTPPSVPTPPPTPAARPTVTPAPSMATPSSPSTATPSNVRIAVICHHDVRARDAALGFVAQLGLEAMTLPDPPNATDSAFFDRLEGLKDPHFAIVHLPANTSKTAAAAPNALPPALLLELGFLVRALGRNRICFLAAGNVDRAPPWEGVVRLHMDDAGTWRLLLARAMKQAGLDVDMNRAL